MLLLVACAARPAPASEPAAPSLQAGASPAQAAGSGGQDEACDGDDVEACRGRVEEPRRTGELDRPALPEIGVPECDAYVDVYIRCIVERLPAESVPKAHAALSASVDELRKEAETDAGRKKLAKDCTTASEAVSRSCGQ